MLDALGYLFGIIFFLMLIVLVLYTLLFLIQKFVAKCKFFKSEIQDFAIELEAKKLIKDKEKENLKNQVNKLKHDNLIRENTLKVTKGDFSKS